MFLRTLFSTDHKVIGLLYGFTSLFFLLVGFVLVILIRWQLAYPGRTIWITPEFYNSLGAMHGTIMVFLGVVPLAVGAFGNYVVPLQIGAPDMAFPRLNLASYWFYALGGLVMLASFFASSVLSRALGKVGMAIVVRVLGLVLCAMAVQFILAGANEATRGLIRPAVAQPYAEKPHSAAAHP